jgi:AraC-like DNA-binding protein
MLACSSISPESFKFEILDVPSIYVHDRRWVWAAQNPPAYFNLWISLAGERELQLGGETYSGSGAAFYLLPPGMQVRGRALAEGGLTNFAMHFRPTLPAARRALAELAPQFREVPVRRPIEVRRMAEECCRGWVADEGLCRAQAHLAGRWLLCEMWNELARPHHHAYRDPVWTLAMEIRAHPSQAWSSAKMARVLGLSSSQAVRVFGEVIGKPPGRFVIEARIERASQLLLDSPMRISEIAEALGYLDVYFFSRQFKQFTGLSPRQVRARAE